MPSNPPTPRRSLAEIDFNWCLSCLRRVYTSFDDTVLDPVRIGCTYSRIFINCDGCKSNEATCPAPMEGMSGDARDLTKILKCAEVLSWDSDEDDDTWPEWDDDFILELRCSLRTLIRDFDSAAKAHRSTQGHGVADNWPGVSVLGSRFGVGSLMFLRRISKNKPLCYEHFDCITVTYNWKSLERLQPQLSRMILSNVLGRH